MTGRVIVASSYNYWRKQKQNKSETKIQFTFGSINAGFLVMASAILVGGLYLFTVNSSAVKGYQIRQIENEITDLKKENEKLRIKEVELKSLDRIEAGTKEINMQELKNISYVEEPSPLALK